MNIINKKISYYERQKKRGETHKSKLGSKQGKNDSFDSALSKLVQAGGGNLSALTCGGNATSAGATELKELATNLTACKENIKTVCGPPNVTELNTTMGTSCDTAISGLRNETERCGAMGNTSCDCWNGDTIAGYYADINTNCNFTAMKEHQKAHTAQKKLCTAAFSQCRQNEDSALSSISTCSTTSDALLQTAAAANAAKTNVEAVVTKITTLSARRVFREKRAAPATCALFITGGNTMLDIVTNTPTADIATASADLVAFAGTCTTAEKTDLTTMKTKAEAAIVALDAFIAVIQEQLAAITGSTASSGTLNSTSTGSATAGYRRRRQVLQTILRRAAA